MLYRPRIELFPTTSNAPIFNGQLIELDTYKDSIRLAGTIDDDGNIPDKVIKQCVETLKSMKEIASPYTNIYKTVATQAIRQANNYLTLYPQFRMLLTSKSMSSTDLKKLD